MSIDAILQQHLFQTKGTGVAMSKEAYDRLVEALEGLMTPRGEEQTIPERLPQHDRCMNCSHCIGCGQCSPRPRV